MNSVGIASLVALLAFGLMGCATEGFAQTRSPESNGTSSYASYDPSSFYQPSPNARPLAVQPPRNVTGAVGGNVGAPAANGPQASYVPSNFYEPSPNARPAAVAAPSNSVANVSGTHSTACSESGSEGITGVSPNVRVCP